jgi:hypothetical protein
VAGSQTRTVVAVEILIKQNVISKMRIGLEFFRSAKNRPPAMLVP